MNDDIHRISDVYLDSGVRYVDAALQNAACETAESLACATSVHSREAARVAGVEQLQKVKRLSASDLTQDDSVGAVTESGLQKVPDGDGRETVLRLSCFEPDEVILSKVEFRRVFDQQNPFV